MRRDRFDLLAPSSIVGIQTTTHFCWLGKFLFSARLVVYCHCHTYFFHIVCTTHTIHTKSTQIIHSRQPGTLQSSHSRSFRCLSLDLLEIYELLLLFRHPFERRLHPIIFPNCFVSHSLFILKAEREIILTTEENLLIIVAFLCTHIKCRHLTSHPKIKMMQNIIHRISLQHILQTQQIFHLNMNSRSLVITPKRVGLAESLLHLN